MRIIAGKYKGRVLKMPENIRPTQDKVRKALFDILGDIEGLSFLDLFAGSGVMGIEAASRGAGKIVLVENNPDCLKIIKNNLVYLPPTTHDLLPIDAIRAIRNLARNKAKFDIIFLDPPYYQGLAKKTLQTLGAYDILAPNGLMIVQHFKKDILLAVLGDINLFRQSRYGDTFLSFYKKIS